MGDTILLRRGTLANLPDLQAGEPGWAEDANQLYIGTGTGSAASAMPIGGYDWCPESFTQASIQSALTAIGTVNKVTLLLRPGTWVISSTPTWTAYTNVTLKVVPGALIQIDTGVTLTWNGPFEAGLYQVFNCADATALVKFGFPRTVYPEWWWSTGEWGVAISSAIASIADVGGEVKFSTTMATTTPINATNLSYGMIFSGNSGAFSLGGSRIVAAHTGVVFDCTGSRYLQFRDFVIKGDAATTPTVGFLLARNSTDSSAGEHVFTNIKTDYSSYFSVAAVYSYGSEVNNYISCLFANVYTGGKTVLHTGYNISSIASTFQTIATGSQSNSVMNFFGVSLYNRGGVTSDTLYLEASIDIHIYGGFWYNAQAAADGRAYVYIDTTNAASNYISLDGLRGEPGVNQPAYGIYIGDTAKSPVSISIINSRLGANTALFYAHDNVKPYLLNILNTAGLISVYNLEDSVVNSEGPFTVRAGGTMNACAIMINEAPTITGTQTNSIITNRAAGKVTIPHVDEAEYNPVITSGVGTITTVAATGSYTKVGRFVHFSFNIVITTNGTGSSTLLMTLPFTAQGWSGGVGRERVAAGFSVTITTIPGGASATIVKTADDSYPGANGYTISGSVDYRM
ncbi:MAG: hypothetical protein ABII90_01740 [Bacteroidota bacterium]